MLNNQFNNFIDTKAYDNVQINENSGRIEQWKVNPVLVEDPEIMFNQEQVEDNRKFFTQTRNLRRKNKADLLSQKIVQEKSARRKKTLHFQHGHNPMSDKYQKLIKNPNYDFKNQETMSRVTLQLRKAFLKYDQNPSEACVNSQYQT